MQTVDGKEYEIDALKDSVFLSNCKSDPKSFRNKTCMEAIKVVEEEVKVWKKYNSINFDETLVFSVINQHFHINFLFYQNYPFFPADKGSRLFKNST